LSWPLRSTRNLRPQVAHPLRADLHPQAARRGAFSSSEMPTKESPARAGQADRQCQRRAPITLRLAPDTIAALRARGPGWTRFAENALRMALKLKPLGMIACAAILVLTAAPALAQGVVTGSAVVIDGDTVVVSGTTVRLKGVDAAERGTALGENARRVMAAIVSGALTCRLTGEKTWGREVGYCSTAAGTDINREIIARGAALACPRYDDRYLLFEQPEALSAQPRSSYCIVRGKSSAARPASTPEAMPLIGPVMAERPVGLVCWLPDDLDRAGRRCGKRAASVRPGGL
jgi:endonuclease YncB( thermonuclease family)